MLIGEFNMNVSDSSSTHRVVPLLHEATGPTLAELRARLAPYGQQHVLRFWDELDSEQQSGLVEQIEQIDLGRLRVLNDSIAGKKTACLVESHASINAPRIAAPDCETANSCLAAGDAGEAVLASGQVGVLIVAGGEGTRLGFDGPKGCFPLGPVSGASLYQLLLEKVVATSRRVHAEIPVYVMTSPSTHEATVKFLDAADWFGVAAECRYVFCQGTMPAVDSQGRILLESKSRICLGPDGHGGVLGALERNGLLDSMQTHGIEHLFYCQVDNPAVPLLDSTLVGRHVLSGSQVTVLVVDKTDAAEKAGTVVSIDGRLHVLEYSLIPEAIASTCDDDGRLRFRAANTGIHLFRTDFLRREARNDNSLPYHPAHKAVKHLDEQGNPVDSDATNAVKFERFVFDIFPRAEITLLISIDREQSFLPLKDRHSTSTSPEAIRRKMSALYRSWLEQAGVDVSREASIEISPLVASNAAELAAAIASTGWQRQRSAGSPSVYLNDAA